MSMYELYLGDCLQEMNRIADHSVDCICADLPYGVTSCAWDSVIPLDKLWTQFKRIIKPNCAIVLSASQPFTTTLISSNIENLKHTWVWNKSQSGSFQNAQYGPLRITEDICVFSYGKVNYYPRMRKGIFRKKGGEYKKHINEVSSGLNRNYCVWNDDYFPTNIIDVPAIREGLHPSQKPTELLNYLITTYSLPKETILDCTMGSGSCGVSAMETGRRFVGIERDKDYFAIAQRRIADAARAAQGQPKQLTGSVSDYSDAPLFALTGD